jgi:hypothetical protein
MTDEPKKGPGDLLKIARDKMITRRHVQAIALATADAQAQTKLIEDLGKTQLAIAAIDDAIKERPSG